MEVGVDFVIHPGFEERASCNRESTFTVEQCGALLAATRWLLALPESASPEARGVEAALVAALPHQPSTPPAADWTAAQRVLRRGFRTRDELLTVYKFVCFAGLYSHQAEPLVIKSVADIREVLAIAPLDAMLVADGVLRLSGATAYDPTKLSDAERLAVVAACCVVLRADQIAHRKESAAVRLVMMTLGGAVAPSEALRPLVRQPVGALIAGLAPAARIVALIDLLRVALADAEIRAKEAVLLAEATNAAGLDATTIRRVRRYVQIEAGVRLPGTLEG